jgi:hypothetical protein
MFRKIRVGTARANHKMSIVSKPALPARRIYLLFGVRQPTWVYRVTIHFVSKEMYQDQSYIKSYFTDFYGCEEIFLLVKQQLDRNGYAPKFPGNFQRQFSTV